MADFRLAWEARLPSYARSICGSFGGAGRSARNEVKMLEAGSQAPDFAVQDHTGKTVNLSDFGGKHVVLWFYPKADTPG